MAAPIVIAGIAALLWLATSIEAHVGAPPDLGGLPVVAVVTRDGVHGDRVTPGAAGLVAPLPAPSVGAPAAPA